ncbi:hypothetical protein [Actinomadura macra]|uniref:hypothetical protein n=1 Tax=Actinomadura macra TaxID=46164 RepID=UPI0008339C01|nr:hypothetical protein [Actinomadura macra]
MTGTDTSRTEERLRDAFDTAAQTVDPGTLAPLTVPVRRKRPAWTVPSAVAAALVLVLVGATALGMRIGRAPNENSVPVAGTPSYLLTITKGRAAVRDLRGREIAVIPEVKDRYVSVAGSGRTFFLVAETKTDEHFLYRVMLSASGRPSRPKPVPGGAIRLAREIDPRGYAASPDGSKVAAVGRVGDRSEVIVIDVRTGTRRTWSAPATGWIKSPTWSPDNRTLGFIWWEDSSIVTKLGHLRLLDTTKPGDDLYDSRPVRNIGTGDNGEIDCFVLNSDGQTLTAAAQFPSMDDAESKNLLMRFSVRTGKPTGWSVRLPEDSLTERIDESGTHLIQLTDGRLSRVEDTRFSWLGNAHNYEDAAW